ncbi:hypothetical protein, partial [uncultured Methylobacterium sp.]|uniref:hypothetical protein n=1 Tax=uncultured Methylobacterium sp. TaxID=157278 RepID=UPI002594471E
MAVDTVPKAAMTRIRGIEQAAMIPASMVPNTTKPAGREPGGLRGSDRDEGMYDVLGRSGGDRLSRV